MSESVAKGTIPPRFIEDLLARTDLVQLINQRVPLKKAGRDYKACCPFHDEKTPSFHVNPQKQFYHCFGCGASGDAINFLKEYDGLSFVEAVETLAQANGMAVPREKLSPQQAQKQAQQQAKAQSLYDVLFLSAKFYRQQLAASQAAKNYLKSRGLTAEIAKQFVIGYAPEGWNRLSQALQADATVNQLLLESGMAIQKEQGGQYDRFRDRVMFPIRDGRGRVIAFGGRILGEGQPKYLNSPETDLFHKSDTLYGLFEIRKARINPQRILVVEGYMDVVALAQFEVQNAVATLGTAITESHLQLLFREVNEVVFCFDGDQAGQKAAWKALELALPQQQGIRSVRFLFLPEGEDPDSMVRQEGRVKFEQRVAQAMPLSDFLLKGLVGRLSLPLSLPEGQQQLLSLIQPYVQQAQGAMPDLLVNLLADYVEIPAWRIGQLLGVKVASAKRAQAVKTEKLAVKVTHSLIRLLRILYRRPIWAEIFPEGMLGMLEQAQAKQYPLFASWVRCLQANGYQFASLEQLLNQQGYAQLVEQFQQNDLPDQDEFLQQEFEVLLSNLAETLQKDKMQQAAKLTDLNSLENLARLQQHLRANKT